MLAVLVIAGVIFSYYILSDSSDEIEDVGGSQTFGGGQVNLRIGSQDDAPGVNDAEENTD